MSFSVTPRAFTRIAKIMTAESEGAALRISVEGGGCSGFQYKFDISTTRESDDIVLSGEGANVYIDSVSLPLIDGSELDYAEDLIGSAFKIVNPQAVASCGCGTSFAL
jgi:iron-sulfur cluster assembly accessory protein